MTPIVFSVFTLLDSTGPRIPLSPKRPVVRVLPRRVSLCPALLFVTGRVPILSVLLLLLLKSRLPGVPVAVCTLWVRLSVTTRGGHTPIKKMVYQAVPFGIPNWYYLVYQLVLLGTPIY